MGDRKGVYVLLEKPKRDSRRLEFGELSEDGSTGSWINSINRMDPIPVGGFPTENGATTPQFFHPAEPNRIQTTAPNVSGSSDDIWQDPDIGYRRHLDTTDFINKDFGTEGSFFSDLLFGKYHGLGIIGGKRHRSF